MQTNSPLMVVVGSKRIAGLLTVLTGLGALGFAQQGTAPAAQAAQASNAAPTAAQVAAALDRLTLDPAEKEILIRLLSDNTFRKAQAVVPVLKPDQNGDLVRCTLEPASDSTRSVSPGAMVAYFDKQGDQMRVSGFQKFTALSILRFAGTVTFPFTTNAPFADPAFRVNGYVGRDEQWAKQGRRSSNLLQSISLAPDTATFTGVPSDPLSFVLLPEGLVYIHGTGTVTYHGSTTNLGTASAGQEQPLTKQDAGETKGGKQHSLIVWSDVKSHGEVATRPSSNTIKMLIGTTQQNQRGYALLPSKDGAAIKMSNGIEARSFTGLLKGDEPDDDFYWSLGVGATVALPNDWTKLFGILCKGGSLTVTAKGVEFDDTELK